jgi:hypothetical protein
MAASSGFFEYGDPLCLALRNEVRRIGRHSTGGWVDYCCRWGSNWTQGQSRRTVRCTIAPVTPDSLKHALHIH